MGIRLIIKDTENDIEIDTHNCSVFMIQLFGDEFYIIYGNSGDDCKSLTVSKKDIELREV